MTRELDDYVYRQLSKLKGCCFVARIYTVVCQRFHKRAKHWRKYKIHRESRIDFQCMNSQYTGQFLEAGSFSAIALVTPDSLH